MTKYYLIIAMLGNLACGMWLVFFPSASFLMVMGCINFTVAGGCLVVLGIDL